MPILEKLFEPITIRGLVINNRLAMPPMVSNLANENGSVSPSLLQHYLSRAKGGVGLIIVEAASIRWDCRGFPRQLCIHDDAMVEGLEARAQELFASSVAAREGMTIDLSGCKKPDLVAA